MNIISDVPWPPTYSVKKNKLAKYVRLRASKAKGLQITIPYRFNLKNIPDILETHKQWIIKKLRELNARKTSAHPHEITLPPIIQTWKIIYFETLAPLKLFVRQGQEVVIMGKMEDQKVRKLLVLWLKKMAKLYLAEIMNRISEEIKLSFSKLTIRDQHSRWGSCSSDKSINLNYKLLLLPKPLAEHVIIHELCHTKVLNHSDKFWQLVASFDPAWKEHRILLKKADQFIPSWLL